MSSLHSAQISHYREQGFVVVPGVINDGEIERYRLRAREIALGDVPEEAEKRLVRDIYYARGGAPLPEDPERALWKILNPDRFDPVMAECLRFPRVLDAAQSLIGEDILAFLMMFIYKPPGVPQSVHPFHQDAVFFSLRTAAVLRRRVDPPRPGQRGKRHVMRRARFASAGCSQARSARGHQLRRRRGTGCRGQ